MLKDYNVIMMKLSEFRGKTYKDFIYNSWISEVRKKTRKYLLRD